MIKEKDLFKALGLSIEQQTKRVFSSAVIDSRKSIPGSIFFALKGEKTDGHKFVEKAFENGAMIAIISQEPPPAFKCIDLSTGETGQIKEVPSTPFFIKVRNTLETLQNIAKYKKSICNYKIVGITGSVGKSSTKELVAEVLAQKFRTYKNPGNYNNEIGLPLTILNTGYGQECIVLEMGFYVPGEIKFLCSIAEPDIGIITNIGTVHAERAGSKEKIAEGKSELIQALPSTGTAILNFDDDLVRNMQEKTTAKVIFYGLTPEADLWADQINSKGLNGIEFTLHYQGTEIQMSVPLLGRHSVQTVLCAAGCGLALGMKWEEIIPGLQKGHTQLRLIAARTKSGALLLDDTYNATPESMLAALDLLKELDGQKIAVLGDMLELGKYEKEGHQIVGKRAAEIVNHLITVGELGKQIAETAMGSGLEATAIETVKTSVEAAELLKYHLTEGDVVLIKGSHGLRMDNIASILENT